jgi:hypothetical protein
MQRRENAGQEVSGHADRRRKELERYKRWKNAEFLCRQMTTSKKKCQDPGYHHAAN